MVDFTAGVAANFIMGDNSHEYIGVRLGAGFSDNLNKWAARSWVTEVMEKIWAPV
jgi:hypothetical protein